MKQYHEALLVYHTDLGQNAVFHNFAIQIALIQYSGRSKHAWALAKPLKEFPKSPIRLVQELVCYTAVFSVVTQRCSGGALRDDTKNGCVADYYQGHPTAIFGKISVRKTI